MLRPGRWAVLWNDLFEPSEFLPLRPPPPCKNVWTLKFCWISKFPDCPKTRICVSWLTFCLEVKFMFDATFDFQSLRERDICKDNELFSEVLTEVKATNFSNFAVLSVFVEPTQLCISSKCLNQLMSRVSGICRRKKDCCTKRICFRAG